ncbi:MAG: LPD1 domain-containing protein [bacterium]|nr:LPD1 domain-containing protein [bacterium]
MKWPDLSAFGIHLSVIPGSQRDAPTRLFVRGADLSTNENFDVFANGFTCKKPGTSFTLSDCKSWFPHIDVDLRSLIQEIPNTQIFIDALAYAAMVKKNDALTKKASKSREKTRTRTTENAERIEDFGEKIGGARKDFFSKVLIYSDLEGMTEVEKTNSVMRDNIWPSVTADDAKALGVGAEALFAIRVLRRKINSNIKKLYETEAKFAKDALLYIETLTVLKNSIFAEPLPKTTKDVHDRYLLALSECDLLICETNTKTGNIDWIETTGNWRDISRLFGRQFNCLLSSWYHEVDAPIHQKIRHRDLFQIEDETELEEKKWAILFPEKFVAPRQKKSESSEDIDADGTKIAHLENVRKVGVDWRCQLDVTAEQLMGDFGFRAIEFGNWLPQQERQEVMNRAYDAFSALVSIMDIGKKKIGFDGALALSFGARGRSGAAAHFEPGREVIHLTRMSGAGSLAHEWGHALDYMLAKHAIVAMRTNNMQISQSGRFMASQFFINKDQRRGRQKIYNISMEMPREFVAAGHNARAPQSIREFGDACHALDEAMRRIYIRKFDDSDAEKKCANSLVHKVSILKDKVACALIATGVSHSQSWENAAEMIDLALSEGSLPELAKHFSNSGDTAFSVALASSIVTLSEQMVQAKMCGPKPEFFWRDYFSSSVFHTNFLLASVKKDTARGDYWATPVEMFARSFETWTYEKMKERGWIDDFLVRANRDESADDDRYPKALDRVLIVNLMNTFCVKASIAFENQNNLDLNEVSEIEDSEVFSARSGQH